MPSSVTIKGLDKLLRKLDNVASLSAARNALRAGALHIKGKVDTYPPSTIANSPSNPTGRWYERGFGPRWVRKRTGGIGGSKTSETLGRKWTTASEAGGLRQVIGNNVSYGEYVQGEKQASFHRSRGWKTVEDIAEQEAETVVRFVQSEIEKALEE